MLPGLLLAATLALILYGLLSGKGFPVRFASLVGRSSRRRTIFALAIGTSLTWAVPPLLGLAALGRLDAFTTMPDELRYAAWDLGLPGELAARDLKWLGLSLTVGIALGLIIIAIRRWLGRKPLGLIYRSPLAVRGYEEFPVGTLLAISAGVAEEAFFRLLLPLLVAIVTGSGIAGLSIGLIAFVALHRHQGWVGMAAVTVAGVALTYLYLLTGLLWVAITAHAIIDLNAFVIRPWLTGFQR